MNVQLINLCIFLQNQTDLGVSCFFWMKDTKAFAPSVVHPEPYDTRKILVEHLLTLDFHIIN
jgi:hypothetical protein